MQPVHDLGRPSIARHAEVRPDHPAVILAGTGATLTYRELDEQSNQVAHLLRRSGLRVGDTVALMCENALPFFVIAWACQRSGLYWTPINTRLTSDEVSYILRDSGARAFFASARWATAARTALTGAPDVLR